uniref:Uncharacterized protein n=1 Tax=Haptolina brevifila TaxID=156173 RepID=A0A7S2FRA1_9EUKA|mmetsp:Transcript_18166/g.36635  ORF Transcript_18166/g.36635 Transcript_18166/m.36635 type:complete len:376 (+) Transcript_18166:105-1232(+)
MLGSHLLIVTTLAIAAANDVHEITDASLSTTTKIMCEDACTVRTSLECDDPTTAKLARRQLLMSWSNIVSKPFDRVNAAVNTAIDTISHYLGMASNLLFVLVMYYGFLHLPRKLMLTVSVVGVFGPMIFGYVAKLVGVSSIAVATNAAPFLFEMILGLAMFCLSVAATTPALAILVMFIVGLLTSEVFRWAMKKAGFDLDEDDKISIRDLYVWIIRRLKDRLGNNFVFAFALDELYSNASKQLRAVKQNQEILERMERIEAMLLALGAPDLRDIQKKASDGLIDNSSANFNATAQQAPTGELVGFDVDEARKEVAKEKKKLMKKVKAEVDDELKEEAKAMSESAVPADDGPKSAAHDLTGSKPTARIPASSKMMV